VPNSCPIALSFGVRNPTRERGTSPLEPSYDLPGVPESVRS
jgi:hypothetical protein